MLLDLDRTLVDVQSFTDYDAAWADVRALGVADAGEGLDTGWTTATRACMTVLATTPPGPTWDAVSAAVARHEQAAVAMSVPMPGADAFIGALVGRPVAVVTLLAPDVAGAVLDHHGLDCPVVVGRDAWVRPKPSGAGLLRALELLESPGLGAVMVGDSVWDAAAAHDAGVGFVGVHSPPSEFARDYPHAPVCASLAEVLTHLG